MSRKIKDIKDKHTGELVYPRTHISAVVSSSDSTLEDIIEGKQDKIDDLDEIRNSAAKGATALQSIPSEYVTSTQLETQLETKQDVISDIEEIRTNAANYKGTVTAVSMNGFRKSQSSGVVDLGYINKQLVTFTSSTLRISPNIYYRNTSTELISLTITLGAVSNSNIINEYFVEFTTRSAGTTISLPSNIKWMNGVTPTFEAGYTYQISIVNNLGTWVKFE